MLVATLVVEFMVFVAMSSVVSIVFGTLGLTVITSVVCTCDLSLRSRRGVHVSVLTALKA